MRRSTRVQALETIKRRKLTRNGAEGSHLSISNASDHVAGNRMSDADKSSTVVGQHGQDDITNEHKESHVTSSASNGKHVTPASPTAKSPPQSPQLFRTTRAQARLLNQQNLVGSPSKLEQFRYSQIKAGSTKVKLEEDLDSPELSREIKSEDVLELHGLKTEDVKTESPYFIKSEPTNPSITDIEECHTTFAAPEEFDVEENPGVLSQPGPRNWGAIYARVKKMRALVDAPVDTMGCERLVQNGVPAKVQRFQLLISLMLSSQTKDEVTCQAVLNLRDYLQKRDMLLSVDGILSMSVAEIDSCICKVGFHNRKADYISRATALLVSDFEGDIPPTIEAMTTLPGVGPKMAHLLMHRGWGVNEGIGVDVHVHRLANMWGWVKGKTPEETRVQLEKWLPRELWVDINPTLVGFGQTICPSKGKKCGVCIVDKKLCKARTVKGVEWKEEKWMKEGYQEMVVEYEKGGE
ncbi:Endonuclease III-like protein [Yarrowia sp. E02]|nr:Endonuclease III-like protein [Yarrowia sp. E02]